MHESLGPKVKVYGLNVPAFGENAQSLAAFKEQAGLTYPVIDHHGTLGDISFPGLNGFPYPRDAIVDQNGTLVYASAVYDAQAVLEIVEDLLAAEE